MTTTMSRPLADSELTTLDRYWRAANYLSACQIYLLANPLLTEPLKPEHIKPRLLGHWGTTPGLNFVWAHLNRAISQRDQGMLLVIGPGHGGPAGLANTWLEGSYSEVWPGVPQDRAGMGELFRRFSFPGGVPSHVAPETPGSIHEGGELGYSLSHAFGAAFDNPDLVVACVVGDGEAETGPLATSWHGHRFINPARDGAVLPILHLNGWKIANPTVLARIPESDLRALLEGYGYDVHIVAGEEPEPVHRALADSLDTAVGRIREIQDAARNAGGTTLPRWPMIVLRTPKGWTGPKVVDGLPVEGTWRSHQVPIADMDRPEHVRMLEAWMKSYRPEELFDAEGRPVARLREVAPKGPRRMWPDPHANGGLLLRELERPDFRRYALDVPSPGSTLGESTRAQGALIRDVLEANPKSFRVFGPDEIASNRWGPVFEVTGRAFMGEILETDDHVSRDGRVMEMLSE